MEGNERKLALVIEILTAQRNEAMNNFVNALAEVNLLREQLKELQNQLGISYPTVKSRLADIIRLITTKEPVKDQVSDVLADLEEGFINVEEAINMINTRRKK